MQSGVQKPARVGPRRARPLHAQVVQEIEQQGVEADVDRLRHLAPAGWGQPVVDPFTGVPVGRFREELANAHATQAAPKPVRAGPQGSWREKTAACAPP